MGVGHTHTVREHIRCGKKDIERGYRRPGRSRIHLVRTISAFLCSKLVFLWCLVICVNHLRKLFTWEGSCSAFFPFLFRDSGKCGTSQGLWLWWLFRGYFQTLSSENMEGSIKFIGAQRKEDSVIIHFV